MRRAIPTYRPTSGSKASGQPVLPRSIEMPVCSRTMMSFTILRYSMFGHRLTVDGSNACLPQVVLQVGQVILDHIAERDGLVRADGATYRELVRGDGFDDAGEMVVVESP